MSYPPSLPGAIIARCFRAANDELGLLPSDVGAFLDACEADGVGVLGWEIWLADHLWDPNDDKPHHAAGSWCGLIPTIGEKLPVVFGFTGDLAAVRRQLEDLDLGSQIEPQWLRYVRINLTIA